MQPLIDSGEIKSEYGFVIESVEQWRIMSERVEEWLNDQLGWKYMVTTNDTHAVIYARGLSEYHLLGEAGLRDCFNRIRRELNIENIPRHEWTDLLLDSKYDYARNIILNQAVSKSKLVMASMAGMNVDKAADIIAYRKRHSINLFRDTLK